MTRPQKRGAVLFFGKANCVTCHAVGGPSNEMFSDFQNHVLGVPQLVPAFGQGTGNVVFDGPGSDEDFGAEQITGDPADRYAFRTSPLRNVALQPAFFHNGAFTRLDEAIRHHLDVVHSARTYNPAVAGVDMDLTVRVGPIDPVLDRLDPLVQESGLALEGRVPGSRGLRARQFARSPREAHEHLPTRTVDSAERPHGGHLPRVSIGRIEGESAAFSGDGWHRFVVACWCSNRDGDRGTARESILAPGRNRAVQHVPTSRVRACASGRRRLCR